MSLDVTSLFTNVDSKLVVAIIRKKWTHIKRNSNTKLTRELFIEALRLVLNNCKFTFKDQIFKQIFGSPMGSPVSPVIADILMEFLEEAIFEKLAKKNIRPLIYFRYVDDIITSFLEEDIDIVLSEFNSHNKHIKFTIEMENENKIAFLETLIIRTEDGDILTDWSHKNTYSGRLLNFDSHLPLVYKRNTILLLATKILKLSHQSFHERNFHNLFHNLVNNNYPPEFIEKTFNAARFLLHNQIKKSEVSESYISLPYIRGLFEQLKVFLKRHDMNALARPTRTFHEQFYTKLKNKINDHEKNNSTLKE